MEYIQWGPNGELVDSKSKVWKRKFDPIIDLSFLFRMQKRNDPSRSAQTPKKHVWLGGQI